MRVLREQRGLDSSPERHGKGEHGADTGLKDADYPQRSNFGEAEIKAYLAGLSGAAGARGQSQPLSPASSNADEGYYTGSSGPNAWEWHVRRERELRGLSETPLQRTPSEASHRRRDRPETPLQRRPAVRRTPSDEDRRRNDEPIRRDRVLLSRSGRQDAINGLHKPPTNDQPPLDRSGSVHVKWTDNMKEYAELSKAQQEWATQPATPTSRPPSIASGKVTPLMPDPLRIVKKSPVDGELSPRRLSFEPIPRPAFASPCGGRGRHSVREHEQPKRNVVVIDGFEVPWAAVIGDTWIPAVLVDGQLVPATEEEVRNRTPAQTRPESATSRRSSRFIEHLDDSQ